MLLFMCFGSSKSKMNKNGGAIMSKRIPLHEAVRPNKSREDSGLVGESLYQLAEALERRIAKDEMPIVAWPLPADELWRQVNLAVADLEASASFRAVHAVALKRLKATTDEVLAV
jgi:hypothetical protein